MAGTVLLTGANGSLALPAVEYLLSTYPTHTLILTVRDDSDQDLNTAKLRRIMSRHANTAASIRKLDLASLEEVHNFSNQLRLEIDGRKLPRLVAIICNAMFWQLSGELAYTKDGYETTFAVNHLAHFALSLRLLGAIDAQRGRIVFLGSEAHRSEAAGFSQGLPTHIPDDLGLLVHPLPVKKEEEMGRGFQRYGTSKLAITMVMYELERRLKMNKDTATIRVITVDPQNLVNSTTWSRGHIPTSVRIMITIAAWLLPLLKYLQPSLTTVEQAAKPVVDIAVADEFAGQEGYFEGRAKKESSPESMNEDVQRQLWDKSVAWCHLSDGDSVIEL